MVGPIPILYGTETGNAEECARNLVKSLKKRGFASKLWDLEDYDNASLTGASLVVIVTSTFGNGDAPANAETTLRYLEDTKPQLPGLRFAVCGLGDRSYPHFAQAGKSFDAALEACGATRVVPRQDCDVDYEPPFRAFRDQVLEWVDAHPDDFERVDPNAAGGGFFGWLKRLFGLGSSEEVAVAEPAAVVARGWTKDRPFMAPIQARRRLNGEGSAKETMHYELALSGADFDFRPGDSFGVVPTNCPEDVAAVVAAFQLDGGEGVTLDGASATLSEALSARCLQHISADLREAMGLGDTTGQHLVDIGCKGLSAQELVDHLRKLQPRLYSVASSPRLHPDRVDFVVETLRYEAHGRRRKGVASTYLADRVADGESVGVYLVANRAFHLPENTDTPVIMIGPGTGVAPFRGFLQEREAAGASGDLWLFFGHQHAASDFLYGDEIEAWKQRGLLTHLDCAWSRDQEEKVYVQNLLRARGDVVYEWLQRGAHVYVCGAAAMEPEVHAALVDIVRDGARTSADEANAFVTAMRANKRYHVDVY